jgi:hypothetical protein
MLYEKGREAIALAGESVEDMVAEIRAEETAPAAAPGAQAAPADPGGQAHGQGARESRARPGVAAV